MNEITKLPYRYQARDEFLMFLPGKDFEATVSGNRISHVGLRFTHESAANLEGQTLMFKLLYMYAAKKFFALYEDNLWKEI